MLLLWMIVGVCSIIFCEPLEKGNTPTFLHLVFFLSPSPSWNELEPSLVPSDNHQSACLWHHLLVDSGN
jgi:hypothetical protein